MDKDAWWVTVFGVPTRQTLPFRYDRNQIPYEYTVEVRNRFKELDLIDRVPDELWTEVHDIVQETEIKTIPRKKKCKKAKRLSEEALQIAVKTREGKSKGEKERYIHLNADDTTLMTENGEELKSLLMKVQEERGKVGLKLNIQKNFVKEKKFAEKKSVICKFI